MSYHYEEVEEVYYADPYLDGPWIENVNEYIRDTYNILLLSIVAMFGFGLLGYFVVPKSAFGVVAGIDALLWMACGWFGWRKPIELTFSLFTVVTGLFLGMLAAFYAKMGMATIFLNAGILTVTIFAGLSIYVHTTKQDFSFLVGFLVSGFFILLGGGMLLVFTSSKVIHLAYASFGALVFCAWILYDTSQLLHPDEEDPYAEPSTPAEAAFELFLDLIGLFTYLLRILTITRD